MKFTNRETAAQQLAARMMAYRGSDSIVVAIPRGGVPVGAVIARALALPLDIFLVKKIGHPMNSEYAIGAVTLEDVSVDREDGAVSPDYVEQEAARIRTELKRRYTLFTGKTTPPDYRGKTVLLVDDGIATGSTLLLAARSIRKAGAAKIVIAVPVAPPSAARMFRPHCEEYVCLYEPYNFEGVGQFYEEFPQVDDEAVLLLLQRAAQHHLRTLHQPVLNQQRLRS